MLRQQQQQQYHDYQNATIVSPLQTQQQQHLQQLQLLFLQQQFHQNLLIHQLSFAPPPSSHSLSLPLLSFTQNQSPLLLPPPAHSLCPPTPPTNQYSTVPPPPQKTQRKIHPSPSSLHTAHPITRCSAVAAYGIHNKPITRRTDNGGIGPLKYIHPAQQDKPIKCPFEGCFKAYKHRGGLRYHLIKVHM
ncbi:hypothetical protein HK100_011038 [Physocladia obscura]|uniref:C2H2-type domain-containing protein n=1 Tax=Physocladia obscura TaxID=109957 RepID=A0AAD5T2F4_9FUNG|nr:hypothetical protein HK100_011038 [Physocladia obscura]